MPIVTKVNRLMVSFPSFQKEKPERKKSNKTFKEVFIKEMGSKNTETINERALPKEAYTGSLSTATRKNGSVSARAKRIVSTIFDRVNLNILLYVSFMANYN